VAKRHFFFGFTLHLRQFVFLLAQTADSYGMTSCLSEYELCVTASAIEKPHTDFIE
jgi:hypothetical protein